MKKTISTSILFLASVAIAVFFLTHDLQAQSEENPPPEGRHPGPGGPREEFMRRHPRLADVEEAEKWLEEARKLHDEINELANRLEPVQKEVRELFYQISQADSDEERDRIRAELKTALDKQDELEIEMAEKRRDFSEKNFKIALERMIQARVEYEETKRRINWRKRVIDRRFPGPGPHGEPGKMPWDRPHRGKSSEDE